MRSWLLSRLPVIVLLTVGVAGQQAAPVDPRPANDPSQKPAVAGQTDAPEKKSNVAFDVVRLPKACRTRGRSHFCPVARCW
jgi:hypothetical protein